jgi:hypothetical protein
MPNARIALTYTTYKVIALSNYAKKAKRQGKNKVKQLIFTNI